jgi:hypothetical protein
MDYVWHPTRPIPARRHGWALAALLVLTLAACQNQPPSEDLVALSWAGPIQQEPGEPVWQRHVRIFGPILLNPSTDINPETRRAAAIELYALGDQEVTEAITMLGRALESDQPQVVDAVTSVLFDEPVPLPKLLNPTIDALRSTDQRVTGRLVAVLARYGTTGLDRLDAVATDPDNDMPLRLGAIGAIAAFHNREAASRLITLLNNQTPEPPEITDAVCDSLFELTGLPYGRDVDRWLTWWHTAGRLPAEDWMRLMMTTLSERIAALERQVQGEVDQRALTEQKLLAVFGELYPALSIEEQARRLPVLLEDPLPRLREFAVGRVARLLRDSVRIAPEVQAQLAQRLTDESPRVRLQAVELLDELDYPQLARIVAAHLDEEVDPQVAEAYLAILQRRPVASALGPLGRRLTQPDLTDNAAEALWAHLIALQLSDDQRAMATGLVTDASKHRMRTPSLARLQANLSQEDTLQEMIELLDHEDPALVQAVAEGLAFRGQLEPLEARSANELVYPALIGALARDASDLTSAQSVVLLAPPAGTTESWQAAVIAVTSRLNAADLLAIETELAALPRSSPSLRRDVLQQALNSLADDTTAPQQRVAIIERLAPMLIALGDIRAAHTMLTSIDEVDLTPMLRQTRFEAAVLAEAYDAAARWQSDPAAWVGLFTALVIQDPDAAGRLREEIVTRFGDLAGDTRIEFENASRRLGGEPQEDSASLVAPSAES